MNRESNKIWIKVNTLENGIHSLLTYLLLTTALAIVRLVWPKVFNNTDWRKLDRSSCWMMFARTTGTSSVFG